MKGAGKSCKHERWNRWASYTSSQLQPSRAREEILLPRISAREATFLSLSLSLHGQDYLPTGLWTGNNYQSLENPSRKKELKTKKEKERKKRKTLLFHDCDYDSFNLRAELLAYARFVSRFRRIARRFVSSLIARGEKGREESRVCQSCGCRGGIGTAVHGSVRPTASTKHLCSNINTGNRGDSQSLLGFVTPVAEFTRLPGGYPYTVFADTSPRTCNLYAVHAHAFPASLARFDI